MSHLLIDGRNLLWRSAWVSKFLSRDVGGRVVTTGGVHGFLNSLLRVHHEYGGAPVIAWEGTRGENFRKSLYPDYKKRKKPDPDLKEFLDALDSQEKILRRILKVCGVDQYSGVNVEADDVIGTLARKRKGKITIFSNDLDLMQLVTKRVTVLAPKKDHDVRYTPEQVEKDFGVPPALIPDYKALAGDSSDGIPGIRGIGPKRASNLLLVGDIEVLIKKAETEPQMVAFRPLRHHADELRLFLELTTIKTDAKLKVLRGRKDADKLVKLLRKYRFRILISKLDRLLALA